MKVSTFWDAVGAIITLALVATVLTKNNTSTDLTTAGTAFSGVLTAAEAG
jgi:hypothetical protein